jgi:serine protease Do
MAMMCVCRGSAAIVALVVAGCLAAGGPRHARADSPAQTDPTAPPASFARIVEGVTAAVVSIRLPGRLVGSLAPSELFDDDPLEGDPEEAPLHELIDRFLAARAGAVIGAGVIVDSAGTTLTSAQVVVLAPDFEVVRFDGTVVKADVVGIDERSGLAVLRLDAARRPFPHLRLGNSDRVVVGEWVIALGAPYGLETTVTAGIISATARPYRAGPAAEFLQTDAVLSAGNAGGPLVNTGGDVIGIATAEPGGRGIGLAVPSNTARKVAADLTEWGRVRRAWLGVTGQTLTTELARSFRRSDRRGVLVADVDPRGPAHVAGLRRGDILLDLDGRPLRGGFDLDRALADAAPGQTARLGLWRAGRPVTALVVLGEEPDPPRPTRGLGLVVRPLGPGIIVTEVDPRGPAARAGVRRGDVIREIDHQPARGVEDLERLARRAPQGVPLVLLLQRGATALYVALTPVR